MQGPNYLDLAKNLADEHLRENAHRVPESAKQHRPTAAARERIGQALISIGERLVPTEARLETSTGPPC
jgi:hypothetical protein